ncbi:hypothetical protein EVAR_41271_1 [Eumeta japonica]|uniref:Uncharacterized protein n=1 Tax=Eumeta variegata TaxID=151549 RepID=A0A4C1XC84_EUMVA|nr:hypothetical protein EVAR_41271_1 [Eumeta japonica]
MKNRTSGNTGLDNQTSRQSRTYGSRGDPSPRAFGKVGYFNSRHVSHRPTGRDDDTADSRARGVRGIVTGAPHVADRVTAGAGYCPRRRGRTAVGRVSHSHECADWATRVPNK